jgi:hypothetical protein
VVEIFDGSLLLIFRFDRGARTCLKKIRRWVWDGKKRVVITFFTDLKSIKDRGGGPAFTPGSRTKDGFVSRATEAFIAAGKGGKTSDAIFGGKLDGVETVSFGAVIVLFSSVGLIDGDFISADKGPGR